MACQAAGDADGAKEAYSKALAQIGVNRMMVWGVFGWSALAPLACGDLDIALRWADDAVAFTFGCYRSVALMARAQVKIACGDMDGADRDAQAALTAAAETGTKYGLTWVLDAIARVAATEGNHREAARIFGAADALRQRTGEVRFPNFDAEYNATVETHLTHVYAKLGLSSRVQLAQEAARHA